MSKKNILMMAVSKGNASTEAPEIKRYEGVTAVTIVGINPNKAEIKELMGYEPKEEPTYVGTSEIDGKQVNFARIDFIVRPDAEKTHVNDAFRMTYFIRNQYRKGSQSGKYMVVDAYNNTAWGTEEDIKAGNPIVYSNGPAKILGKYRPAYVGEWELMNFIRQFLCIGSAGETNGYDYINGSWVPKTGDALKDCECSFTPEEIQQMFKGNFSCVKDAIALQPTNKVKVLFGIRTTEGREYQDIYTNYVLRNSATSTSKLQEKIEESKAAGGLSDRTYDYFGDLREYKVEATDLTEAPADPFAAAAAGNTPWGNNN